MPRISKLIKSESGAVTADWVVLTAIIAGFAVAGVALYMPAVNSAADRVVEKINDV